jgi:hypothetical protein
MAGQLAADHIQPPQKFLPPATGQTTLQRFLRIQKHALQAAMRATHVINKRFGSRTVGHDRGSSFSRVFDIVVLPEAEAPVSIENTLDV